MTDLPARKRWSIGWIVAGIAIALLVAVIGLGVILFSQYVQTEDADAASAAREFQAVRGRLAGQIPLLEVRGAEPPVFHRDGVSALGITSLHALVYSRRDESLRRFNIPLAALRVISVGGYIRLIDFGMPGDQRGRLTLADLEQHGPGLIVDVSGSAVAPLAAGDALFGTTASHSQVLMWTE
jgi:hypothetical protein